jgi:acetyl esterase/lipase
MKFTLTLIICFTTMNLVQGQEAIPLYEGQIPNSKPAPNEETHEVRPNGTEIISAISVPSLIVFLPKVSSNTGAAVIICPGGGYHINAIKHEGVDIAKKFNEWGIAAFVLKYRIPSDATMINKEIGPLQDAQQAIRIVRENARKWDIDTSKIGIMGFSAGGHLAATAATHFREPVIEADGTNLRPDFLILGYPVISFSDRVGHTGSRTNLLGESPSPDKVAKYSNELRVTMDTPPAFLIHASDDKAVVPANSIAFYESLLKHNVTAELHIYERGGHGFGMDNPTTEEKWMSSLRNWLISRDLMSDQGSR